MSGQAEPFVPAQLDYADKNDLQQREVQMVEHVQDTAPHQHLNNIRVKKGQRDLSEMEELFEKRGHRETEPNIKLLLAKIGGIMVLLFISQGLVVFQKDGNVV